MLSIRNKYSIVLPGSTFRTTETDFIPLALYGDGCRIHQASLQPGRYTVSVPGILCRRPGRYRNPVGTVLWIVRAPMVSSAASNTPTDRQTPTTSVLRDETREVLSWKSGGSRKSTCGVAGILEIQNIDPVIDSICSSCASCVSEWPGPKRTEERRPVCVDERSDVQGLGTRSRCFEPRT